MKPVAPLHDFGRTDLASAGGKAANLGELVRCGFPVPDGFVVTTDAYAAVAGSARTVGAFESIEVPEEIRVAIADAYAGLGGGPVAVRSSATAEDLPGAAFAGQQDTFLNVVGESALLDAVRRCWGSLWTDRAVAYRSKRAIDSDGVRIAVVVQRMVEAETAGVLFTADPVTGARDRLVVDASSGLGEAVVSGLVTPDHYVLAPDGEVRDWSPGRREIVIRSADGGGVTRETGGTAQRLPAEVLTELARLGTEVAQHFGRPQDIEWAVAHGRVHLLQARPMTALPPPPVRLNAFQRKLGSVLLEYVPVRPYPIDMSTWLPRGPAGLMGKVTGYFGLRGAFEDFLLETDGVVDRLVPPKPRPSPRLLGTPFRLAALARRHDPARWTEDPRFTRYLAEARELAGQDLTAMPWEQLLRVSRQAMDLVQPVADLRIDYLPRTGLSLLRLLIALKLLGRGTMLGDLIMGARTRTGDANRGLEALAAQVRATPPLKAAVDDLDLARAAEFPEFDAAFGDFLAEYGHRETSSPILVSPPTWGEAPGTVLGMVKVLAGQEPKRTEHAPLRELLEHRWLRGPRRRARLTRWVEAARAGIAFREDSHFYFTMPLPVLRRALLEIGARLRAAGILATAEDVFHLRWDELERIPAPERADADALREAVRARSAKREELSGVRLIDPGLVFPRSTPSDALVAGTPAGGGTATGPARIIRDMTESGRLNTGDVLVCPYTNPSWTPLFQRAAAVVVDAGGPASHAAIVAREYGIPAVMGTVRGTTALRDGDLVTVDGDAGLVTSADS